MARIFRRAANKVMNSRDGHESIGLLISDEKVVYESYQKIVMAQVDGEIKTLQLCDNFASYSIYAKVMSS